MQFRRTFSDALPGPFELHLQARPGKKQREQRAQHDSFSALAAARTSVSEGQQAAVGVAASPADFD
eukprot:4170928-Lingulodinium_polyedra.AAC.1